MSRISKYPIVITPADDDVIPVVQSGITKKMTLNDLKAYAVQELGDTYVRFLWYQEISSGTSGTITPPTGGTIVLDQWAAGIDAVTSKIGETGQRPSFESAKDASGNIITATLDGSGNWTISGTPSAYPIAICYVYDVKLSQADRTKSLEELETDQALKTIDSPMFATVKCTNLTDGYVPKHTSDTVGLEDSLLKQLSVTTIGIVKSAGGFALVSEAVNAATNIYFRDNIGDKWAIYKNNTAQLAVWDYTAPAGNKLVFAQGTGNICTGGKTACGTGAVNALGIGAGTAPSSSPADMCQLWVEDVGGAGQAELRVRDELGNVTTLSPHHISMFIPAENVPLPWTHYHENALLGIKEEVDMSGLVKAVEELTGRQFSFVQSIPKNTVVDYLSTREVALREKLTEDLSYEEEVSIKEATEIKEIESTTKKIKGYEQTYTFENGERTVQSVPVYNIAKIMQKVLKPNVRLCDETGKFFIKRQPAMATLSAELTKRPVNNLPKWITDRI